MTQDWCFLAYRVLGCSVPEARQRVTYREFVQFRLYRRVHPWGDDWDQAAMLAALLHNAHSKKCLDMSDFRPNYRGETTRQTPEEMFNTLLLYSANRSHC